MNLGRDVRRLLGGADRHGLRAGSAAAREAAALELLPLAALRAEADRLTLTLFPARPAARTHWRLDQARLLREIARRTGEPEAASRAATLARRAGLEPGIDASLRALARLEEAGVALDSADQHGDAEAATVAAGLLDQAEPDAALAERPAVLALRARLASRAALGGRDLEAAIAAARLFDTSAGPAVGPGLTPPVPDRAVEALLLRAELLTGFGAILRDRSLHARAADDLADLTAALDPAYRPISWSRAEALRGEALSAAGDLAGDPRLLAEGCAALAAATGAVDADHSPLDWVRAAHALGRVLLAMAEAGDEPSLYDRALEAIAPALKVLEALPASPLRASVAHDRAAAIARRAERRGDLGSLEGAERLFHEELRHGDARIDPVGWAVTQLALARVYAGQAALRGDRGERADAATALIAALDVFAERGLKSLTETAVAALARLREPA